MMLLPSTPPDFHASSATNRGACGSGTLVALYFFLTVTTTSSLDDSSPSKAVSRRV